ncbi:MAG: DUF3048 domain-containing protein [Clostridia bacterium]
MKHKRKINRIKTITILILMIALAISLSSCEYFFESLGNIADSPTLGPKSPTPTPSSSEENSPEPSETETEQPTETATSEPTPTEEVKEGVLSVNPLTGETEYMSEYSLTTKPVAIILENMRQSLPQLGLSEADIVVEMQVEYEISRFLAIYQDPYNIKMIGAVRSLRSYFTDISLAFNAYLFHYGYSEYGEENAKQDLIDRGINTVNGISGTDSGYPYWRDAQRITDGYESVHSVVTAGANIQNSMQEIDRAETIEETKDAAFNFSLISDTVNGTKAEKVYLTGLYISSPYFIYDNDAGRYLRYQFGDKQIDGATGEQLSVENLFVVKMDTVDIMDTNLHIAIATDGTGAGYYFNDGKYIEITWSRETESSEFVFSYNGEELKVAIGDTWICCIPTEDAITIK